MLELPPAGTVALYPGSFKPPHAAHLHAIRYLLESTNAEFLIVVIANRARLIPGTAKALSGASARNLLQIQLEYAQFPLEKISLEIAEHRAVDHALGVFERVTTAHTLLFGIGRADYENRDQRFAKIAALSAKHGVSAQVAVIPEAANPIRATSQRIAVSQGAKGQKLFFDGLADTLNREQRESIWRATLNACEPVATLVKAKLYPVIVRNLNNLRPELAAICEHNTDPEFTWHDSAGARFRAKYAGDTVGKTSFEADNFPKPAARLGMERRVLRHLTSSLDDKFEVPVIRGFDNRLRLLVTQEFDGQSVAQALAAGRFDRDTARLIGEFLACLHNLDMPGESFWDEPDRDRDLWEASMSAKYRNLKRVLGHEAADDWRNGQLSKIALNSPRRLMHMTCEPRFFSVADERLHIREFERSISYGDVACDLGSMLAAYIKSITQESAVAPCIKAVGAMIIAYRFGTGVLEASFVDRVAGFTTCALLENDKIDSRTKTLALSLCSTSRQFDSLAALVQHLQRWGKSAAAN